MSEGMEIHAQELILPAKWTEPLRHVRPLYEEDTLTIRILGDIMMHSMQISEAGTNEGTYDFNSYFVHIRDRIREADIAIANMEFTLAGKPYTGYPCFSAPDEFALYLAGCGLDIFLAANNHIFDKGTAGAERTLEMYRKLAETHGIRFTGLAGNEEEMAGNTPLFIREKGIKLALLNFTYGTNNGIGTKWPKTNYEGEKERLTAAMAKAETADYMIVFPHWGAEYRLTHSESQEKTALWLVENGADWIIGAHPHVIQDRGMIENVSVAYSLGNAVSNMSAANTQLGLMATIRIARESDGDLTPLPLELEYLWCSRPGGYDDSYTVIPVAEFIGRQNEWHNPADYEKMMTTYERVKHITGINK